MCIPFHEQIGTNFCSNGALHDFIEIMMMIHTMMLGIMNTMKLMNETLYTIQILMLMIRMMIINANDYIQSVQMLLMIYSIQMRMLMYSMQMLIIMSTIKIMRMVNIKPIILFTMYIM